uniref:Uncharacterized protein n=1 Tax=Nelumbo nucifera TaxID=4432 RepID=A0A822Y018_NELNU|nr:TPA_asm: hypothetical protein HUJ06_028722 [Nelumbo nucifera]
MGWRYNAGLFLIVTVVIIWVTSAEVTQGIFTDYKQPFAVTYLGASLMVVYLPIAFIKDWLCNSLRSDSSKNGKPSKTVDRSCAGLGSPLKFNGLQKIEMELQGSLPRKDSETDLSAHEEGRPLVPKHEEEMDPLKHDRELPTKEIAKYGFYIAPIWFVTEVRHYHGCHLLFFFSFTFSRSFQIALVVIFMLYYGKK